jgi:hypothetical protein
LFGLLFIHRFATTLALTIANKTFGISIGPFLGFLRKVFIFDAMNPENVSFGIAPPDPLDPHMCYLWVRTGGILKQFPNLLAECHKVGHSDEIKVCMYNPLIVLPRRSGKNQEVDLRRVGSLPALDKGVAMRSLPYPVIDVYLNDCLHSTVIL